MMKAQLRWDYVKAFKSAPVEGLTWGQLFNLAPRPRAGCTFGMVMERVGRKKRRGAVALEMSLPVAEVHVLHEYLGKPISEP